MTDRRKIRHLYALLMELPKEIRHELVVEEWDLASGKEPSGATERANWYRSALTRLARPNWQNSMYGRDSVPDVEDALDRAREELEARETSPENVGVLSG